MHRWHFQRLLRWLVPVVVSLAMLSGLIARQKARGLGLSFLDDDAYVSAAVAENLVSSVTYGVNADERMPATRDVLWRLLLGLTGGLLSDPVSAAYLWGAVLTTLTLLLLLRMARLLFPFPPFILYSVTLLIFTPDFLPSVPAGAPVALATALTVAACLLHLEGLSGRRNPLSLASAFLLGLAATLRIEFLLVWLLFWAHAAVLNVTAGRDRAPFGFMLFRGVNGLLAMLLCLLPQLAWNRSILRIPWPQTPGAPFTMDVFATRPPGEALSALLGAMGSAIPTAYGMLFRHSLLGNGAICLLSLAGAVMIGVLAFRQETERPYTLIPFLLILLPLLYAAAYPFVGWEAVKTVYPAFNPLFLLSATFFFFRLPFIIEGVYRKWKEGIPEAAGFKLSWMVVGSLLFTLLLWRMEVRIRSGFERLEIEQRGRNRVAHYLHSAHLTGQWVATDRPGWMAYRGRVRPLDVTGGCGVGALSCLDENGRMNEEKLADWLNEKKPRALILWDPVYRPLASRLPAQAVAWPDRDRPESGPDVWLLNHPGQIP